MANNLKDQIEQNGRGTREYFSRLSRNQLLRLSPQQAEWIVKKQEKENTTLSQIVQECITEFGGPRIPDYTTTSKRMRQRSKGPAQGRYEERTAKVVFGFRITMAQYDYLVKLRSAGWTMQRILCHQLQREGMPNSEQDTQGLIAVHQHRLEAARKYNKAASKGVAICIASLGNCGPV